MAPIANRVIERQLRRAFTEAGYGGGGARIVDLDLVAIERPGWVQVFTFHVEMRAPWGDRVARFGVVRDDERAGRRYELFESKDARDACTAEWSGGLISVERSVAPTRAVWILLALFGGVLLVALVSRSLAT